MKKLFLVVALIALSSWVSAQVIKQVSLAPYKNSYNHGTTLKIHWNFSGIASSENVKITLWKLISNNSTCLLKDNLTIITGVSGYSWKIPSQCKNPHTGVIEKLEGEYKIKVRWKGDPEWKESHTFKISSGTSFLPVNKQRFSISHPEYHFTLAVENPTNGSNWKEGTLQTIRWKLPKKDLITGYKIELYNYNGSKFIKTVTEKKIILPFHAKPKANHSYSWNIPGGIYEFPGNYKIKIMCGRSKDGYKKYTGFSKTFHIEKALKTVKVNIYPSIGNPLHRRYKYRHVPAALDRYGRGEIFAPSGTMRVGFQNHYEESGIGGINYKYEGYLYRGILYFDLKEFTGRQGILLKATLHMKKHSTQRTILKKVGFASIYEATNTGYCAKSLYLMNASWTGFNTPAMYLKEVPKQDEVELNVTGAVNSWLHGSSPNHGFEVAGINESLSENNEKCITFYQDIYLQIEFLEGEK